jgi:hypothetical protein
MDGTPFLLSRKEVYFCHFATGQPPFCAFLNSSVDAAESDTSNQLLGYYKC